MTLFTSAPTTATPTTTFPSATGLGNVLTTTSNGVSTAASSAKTAVTSTLSSMVTNAESVASNAVSSISKIFTGSTTSSLANSVNSTTSNILSTNTAASNATAAAVKTQTPDAVTASFSQATPKATIFKTTNASTALKPTNLSGQTATTNTGILGDTATLISRYGSDITSGVSGGISTAISSVMKNNIVSGMFSGISSVTTNVSAAKTGVTNVVSSTESVVGSAEADFRNIIAGLATSLTGNSLGMDGFYNSSLPVTTDANGNAIPGIPTTLGTSTIASIFSAAKNLGCSVANIDLNAYGAEQSMFAGLLGLASQLNMTTLLQNLLNCNRMDSNMQSIGAGLFQTYAGTNAPVANTIVTSLPSGTVAGTKTLAQTVVTNPNVTTSAQASDVKSILTTINVTPATALSTGTTVASTPVYDLDVIDACTPATLTALASSTGSQDLSGISTETALAA